MKNKSDMIRVILVFGIGMAIGVYGIFINW